MPELPEVETVCRALRPHLLERSIGDVTVHAARLRGPLGRELFADILGGPTVVDVRRRAKYIIVEFDNLRALVLHLGMSGSFRLCPAGSGRQRHDHIVWFLSDGHQWHMNDPRRFGSVELCQFDCRGGIPERLQKLGPDPFDAMFTAALLLQMFRSRSQPVKNALLDQTVVSGIGNIYASEALHLAEIAPDSPCSALPLKTLETLIVAVRNVLASAVECGGSTIRSYRTVDGSEGKFAQRLLVYGRDGEPCARCGGDAEIQKMVQAGRSTFFCPACQPRERRTIKRHPHGKNA